MPIHPLRPTDATTPSPAATTVDAAPAATPPPAVADLRFHLPKARYKLPLAPGEQAHGVRPWTARLRSSFSEAKSRALAILGRHRHDRPAAIHLDLPAGDQVTSSELVAAVGKLDVASLSRDGIPPLAVFDFDQTLMSGEVFSEFAALAMAERCFLPEANPGVVDLLASLDLPALRRADLERRDVNDNVALAHRLMQDRLAGADPSSSLSLSEFFFVLTTAMRGLTPAEVAGLGERLFEKGAPGKAPYKTHVLDPSPGPNDSARDLIAALTAQGIECHVVTAGMTVLARIGARHLGIPADRVVGGDLEVEAGRLTGRAVDILEVGKSTLVRRTIGAPPLLAFGDSAKSDAPMLKLALVKGFMVDPRPAFLDLVREQALDFITLTYKPPPGA